MLEELWRRAVLAWFVRQGWLEQDEAAGMLCWPHSGFGAYLGPSIEDREGVLRVARYSARAPVAESRLRYDPVPRPRADACRCGRRQGWASLRGQARA